MNKKRHRIIFEIAFTAILIALIVALSAPPYIGFGLAIPFLGVQITILHIPVIIGAFLLGRKYAWLLGLVFGLGSLWAAFQTAVLVFQNPLISVLPRVLFGVAAFELFNVFKKVIKNTTWAVVVSAVLATMVHTVLVLLAIMAFGTLFYDNLETYINAFVKPVITFNALVEIVLAGIITLPIYKALINVMNQPEKE
ncbi:MAG: ECF transporter S component [Bacilli bacterium]|nr:ECF transporter S component [Bacilli bacterium]MDY0063507.1 ECF transporter S component [Bacilli bacterium]